METSHVWWPLVLLLSVQHVQAKWFSNTAASRRNILLLFDRIAEPLFLPKGDKNNIVFDLPTKHLTTHYQSLVPEIRDRWERVENKIKIHVKRITFPNISYPMSLGRRENFSPFLPYQMQMASSLVETFLEMETIEDFVAMATYSRDRINPYMFTYAVSVALLHRSDTKQLSLPPFAEVFPEKYMDSEVLSICRHEANVVSSGNRRPIVIPRNSTATDLDPEHHVAYFREDIGINLQHWEWHLYYPANAANVQVVKKDRRGELFYYFHQQIVARYNFERLSNKLARVKRLLNWHEPMEEGYFPKLDNIISSKIWPSRNSFTTLQDINREINEMKFDIQDLERWRDRIYEAIHSGSVINETKELVELTETDGIDILGNMIEASMLSVNPKLYGNLHNLGHVMVGFCHDPDGRYSETFGVMADPTTAMRDPLFYRWHAFIDSIFQEHKNVIPKYTVQQLSFDKVHVTDVEVLSVIDSKNVFYTFWQQNDIDLSRGLDFAPRGPVLARFTHLQYAPFVTMIQVENGGPPRVGTVRIFMAPKSDERNLPMSFRVQRSLYIEIDKFTIWLKRGSNIIRRHSNESSVTIPFERTFRNLSRVGDPEEEEHYTFCGCGWPQHMLIPKGREEGLPAVFFVMVSDGSVDKVKQSAPEKGCRAAHSYCGLYKHLYPDSRSMGYPFDRVPRDGVNTVREFMTPNMGVIDVKIQHFEITVGTGPGNTYGLPPNLKNL